MNNFTDKYGVKNNNKVNPFHQSRRMFCVYKNKLYIADANLPCSHAEWFEQEGWITPQKDDLMNEIMRGLVNDKGDIYFYTGYDFEINDEIETIFFYHLKNLAEKLNLNNNAQIYGGLIKSKPGTIWKPIKKYGELENYLK